MTSTADNQSARRFIKTTKTCLAVLLLVSLVLIGQHASQLVYAIGILLLIATVALTFTFNNLPENMSFVGIVKGLVVTWVIIAGVVWISVLAAPFLTSLGN